MRSKKNPEMSLVDPFVSCFVIRIGCFGPNWPGDVFSLFNSVVGLESRRASCMFLRIGEQRRIPTQQCLCPLSLNGSSGQQRLANRQLVPRPPLPSLFCDNLRSRPGTWRADRTLSSILLFVNAACHGAPKGDYTGQKGAGRQCMLERPTH